MEDTSTDASRIENPVDFWMKPHACIYNTLRTYNRKVDRDVAVPIYRKDENIVQSCQLQMGSKLILDYPTQSSIDAFYFLNKSLQSKLCV